VVGCQKVEWALLTPSGAPVSGGCPFPESDTTWQWCSTTTRGLCVDRDQETQEFLGRGACGGYCFPWPLFHTNIDPQEVCGTAHRL